MSCRPALFCKRAVKNGRLRALRITPFPKSDPAHAHAAQRSASAGTRRTAGAPAGAPSALSRRQAGVHQRGLPPAPRPQRGRAARRYRAAQAGAGRQGRILTTPARRRLAGAPAGRHSGSWGGCRCRRAQYRRRSL